jgi:hypothetical protein
MLVKVFEENDGTIVALSFDGRDPDSSFMPQMERGETPCWTLRKCLNLPNLKEMLVNDRDLFWSEEQQKDWATRTAHNELIVEAIRRTIEAMVSLGA